MNEPVRPRGPLASLPPASVPRRPMGAPAGSRSSSSSMAQQGQTDTKKDLSHVPCKFQRNGGCTAGSACVFSHAQPEDGRTKQVCQYFQKGTCKFGRKCALAHILPGQPMSFDRKNKKAAGEAQAQMQTDSLGPSPSATSSLPPIQRTSSNGTPSTTHAIPAKPASPARPNGLPPIPTAAGMTVPPSTTKSAPEPSSAWGPSTSRSPPIAVQGFTLASLFPASSASKTATVSPGGGLPPRPPPSGPSATVSRPSADSTATVRPPTNGPAASFPRTSSFSSATHRSSVTASSAIDASATTHPSPANTAFAFGSAVRPPPGTSFPSVERRDIVFGTTDRNSPPDFSSRSRGPSDESPLRSSLYPSSELVTNAPSIAGAQTSPTALGPPHPRRTSHGLGTPPAASSYSPQPAHLAPMPLSPTRRTLVPPLSASNSYNAAGSGHGPSPFSTSPFSGPRGLFLSSSYDNHVLERSNSFGPSGQLGQPASMVDRADGRWGGRADASSVDGLDEDDWDSLRGGRVFEDDDGEDFLPSSLNELLTEQEMERRTTRRGSNNGRPQPTLGPPPPPQAYPTSNHFARLVQNDMSSVDSAGPDEARARMVMELHPLPRGHHSVPSSSSTVRPGALTPMRSPWDDDGLAAEDSGTGRTVGRGRNTTRRPPVPFETQPITATNDQADRRVAADGQEGGSSYKIGPSHASVAFLPDFGERRQPSTTLADSFGHLTIGSGANPHAPSSSHNPSTSLLSSSLHRPPTTHLYAPPTTSTTTANGFPSLFANPPDATYAYRPPSSATPWTHAHQPAAAAPLTPAELAASHEPGMSLPPGLGIGLGRTRGPLIAFGSGGQEGSSSPWGPPTPKSGGWGPSGGARSSSSKQAQQVEEDEIDDDVLFD